MATAPIFEIRLVSTTGTLMQYLPDYQSIDMSPVYCDAGTIQFKYPQSGINFSLIQEDKELAVTMNGVEIPELRSLIETLEGDDADDAEEGALWTITARTAVGKLNDAIVYPANWTGIPDTKPTAVTYSGKNVGYILNDLFNKAKGRTTMNYYSWDFTDTHDSSGNAWTPNIDLSLDIGTGYLDLMKTLNQNGWCEFRVDARVIHVWNYGAMGRDRTLGPSPLVFRKGRDVKESPRKIDTADLKTVALVSGADNTVFEEVDSFSGITQYGRREVLYSAGSIAYDPHAAPHQGALELAGDAYLQGVSKPQTELTHGLHFETEDQPRPITNFTVGDWAYTDVGKGLERFRILQWVISVASDSTVTGSITMNWLFNTQLSQVSSSVTALENGSTNSGSAPKNDGIPPAKVTDVIPISANYLVNNLSRANLSIQWVAVTQNSDGSAIFDLDYYSAVWKYNTESTWRPSLKVEAEDGQTVAMVENLEPGLAVDVRVRAVDYWGNPGEWSDTKGITLAGDTIPPTKPDAPIVKSNVGTLRLTWSGFDTSGASMPPDLAGVEVHVSTSDFIPSSATKVDVLPPGVLADTLTQGLVYDREYWVKLVAFDTTGNKSEPSDTTNTSHAVLKQVVSTEIGTGQVGLANTTFSDVGNLIDDGTFEIDEVRAARQLLIGTQAFAFDNATASNGVWSIRCDPRLSTSNESIRLQGSLPVKPGERVFGAADYRQTSDVPVNSYLTLAIKWVDKLGGYLTNTGTSSDVFYTLSDNGFAPKDNNWHSRVTNVSMVAPPNSVNAEIWLISQNRTTGTIWVDAVEVRKQIDTLLIAQAAITTAQIADLAVNNAKISDLSVGKLTAGTLSADIVIGARIKTADTGARVELNSGGIGAWDETNRQTVDIDGTTGAVTVIGTLKSGITGKRVEINPGSTYLPEFRFYPNQGSNYSFINAVPIGSVDSAEVGLGMNSGQYTANGITTESRILLSSGGASLELVDTDLQGQNGPGIYVSSDNWISMDLTNHDGSSGGLVYVDETQAQIGTNTGDNNAARMWVTNNGKIIFTGEMSYFTDAQSAMLMGHLDGTDGPVNGVICTWGFTLGSIAYPVVTPYDDEGSSYTCICVARSTTGWSVHYGGNSTGAGYGVHYWSWRV